MLFGGLIGTEFDGMSAVIDGSEDDGDGGIGEDDGDGGIGEDDRGIGDDGESG